jgi:hypothetical protein
MLRYRLFSSPRGRFGERPPHFALATRFPGVGFRKSGGWFRFKVSGAGLTDLEAQAPEPFLACGKCRVTSGWTPDRAASLDRILLFTKWEFRPIPVGRNLLLGIAKLLPQVVPVKRETLQVVSLAMTGLVHGGGPVFHIVENRRRSRFTDMGMRFSFWVAASWFTKGAMAPDPRFASVTDPSWLRAGT